MQIGLISGHTAIIGKDQGYLGLPIRQILVDCSINGSGTPAIEAAWLPTPDEIAAINAGAPVILRILGVSHPPVMIYVGKEPGL